MTTTSRAVVRTGIAEYFGGSTYDAETRAYRGSGPLVGSGLSTVRAYQPKRASDTDYVWNQAAGRGMGASMVVELGDDTEIRRAGNAGGGVSFPAGGRKRITYTPTLHIFHLAYAEHAEDAEADVDALIEAIKGLFHADVTLGRIPGLYQAGESPYGIRTRIYPSVDVKEKTTTYASIKFEAEVEIVA